MLAARRFFTIIIIMPWVFCMTSFGQVTFASQNYALKAAPFEVVVGDFNDDGRPDVAVFSAVAGTVSILLNNGDGTLAAPMDFPAVSPEPGGPTDFSALAVGDFNNDNNLDVLVAQNSDSVSGNGEIAVLLGNGKGVFGTPIITSLDFFSDTFLGVGDFNADNKPDVVVLGADPGSLNGVITLLGNGDGTFSRGEEVAVGISPVGHIVADVNHDGKLDLVISAGIGTANTLFVFLGDGNGTFHRPKQFMSQAPATASLIAGDFNHDGEVDLVSTSFQPVMCEFGVCHAEGPPGALAVMLGSSDGSFGGPGVVSSGQDFLYPAVGDFDGDGNPDIAVESRFGKFEFGVYFGNGQGNFSAPSGVSLTALLGAQVADFNGDGLMDLVALGDPTTGMPPPFVELELNTTPGFSLMTSSSVPTVQPGESASYTITIGQQNGFVGSVTVSCFSPPVVGIQCSVSPSSTSPGDTVILNVNTTGSVAAISRGIGNRHLWAISLPAGLGLLFLPASRPNRRVLGLLVIVLLLGGLGALIACGGGRSSKVEATPAGNYTITVSGISGTIQRSIRLGLMVE